MQQPISDRAAIEFSKAFYGGIAKNATVGAALQRARKDLFRDEEAEWAVPVLYLNGPDDRLLRSTWKQIAAIAAGTLLLGLLGFASWRQPSAKPPPTSQDVILPQGAKGNPLKCPSPQGLDIAFVKIEPGTFEMGDKGMKASRPVHQVTITKPYCIGAYEVTKELWSRVLGIPQPPDNEKIMPVRGVTFDEAQQFFAQLNQQDRSSHYRLPTEAEWELAARAKTQMRFSFADDPEILSLYANCKGGKDGFADIAPVGQLKPNPAGLFDMHGNVFEWVQDWYETYPDQSVQDPPGPREGTKKVRRGGSWNSRAQACSSAARSDVDPTLNREETGFRILREIPPS
jgi:hypothetical protein